MQTPLFSTAQCGLQPTCFALRSVLTLLSIDVTFASFFHLECTGLHRQWTLRYGHRSDCIRSDQPFYRRAVRTVVQRAYQGTGFRCCSCITQDQYPGGVSSILHQLQSSVWHAAASIKVCVWLHTGHLSIAMCYGEFILAV